MCSDRKVFSVNVNDYRLLEEIGNGGSATVYKAIYIPTNELVAVKRLDLDRCNSNLDDIRKEAQTMCLIDHPNIIKAYCSFVVEQYLWVVMAFMAEGSCLHLMKVAYPDGFEESVIGTVLKETLKALGYLHRHGHIHRDIKAGNILLDSNGMVKLGDFGVSACMFDHGDRQRLRNTFVGTPCWMAPEVLQPGSGGYDFKADIWSFGITALELAHGHAPFSKYPPMKVLLMTIQNAPPGLDYDRDKKFSKSFKEMVSMCLVKDQTKRPTAEKLLKHPFFKNAKPPEHSIKSLLIGLPPFAERVKTLNLKDAAQLALKKMPSSEQEALSQSEYKRGVSAWKFDIEDLKAQASLEEDDESMRSCVNNKDASTFNFNMGKSISMTDIDDRLEKENQSAHAKSKHDIRKAPSFSGPLMLPSRASANSFSAPIRSSVGLRDSVDEKSKANVVQIKGRFSVTSETVDLEKDIPLGSVSRRCTQESLLRKSASVGDWQVDSKHMPSNQLPKEVSNRAVTASILKPQLQNLFQQTTFQQALIVNLLNELEQTEAVDAVQTEKLSMGPCNLEIDAGVEAAVSAREQLLLMKISELEASTTNLTNELAEARSKNLLLQQQLHAACSREEERIAEEGTT